MNAETINVRINPTCVRVCRRPAADCECPDAVSRACRKG
jgi:hypothetical protein